MESHVTILAWIRIIYNALSLGLALIVLLVFGGLGFLAGGPLAALGVGAIASVIIGLWFIASALGLACGFGLLAYREWARILSIVLSFFNLFEFPIGTALAVYNFWVAFHPETISLFRTRSSYY